MVVSLFSMSPDQDNMVLTAMNQSNTAVNANGDTATCNIAYPTILLAIMLPIALGV